LENAELVLVEKWDGGWKMLNSCWLKNETERQPPFGASAAIFAMKPPRCATLVG
jgi:hypothetical protein